MIDQSASMGNEVPYKYLRTTKADVAVVAAGRLIQELALRCRSGYEWRNYFDICVVGYSGHGIVSATALGQVGVLHLGPTAGDAKEIAPPNRYKPPT